MGFGICMMLVGVRYFCCVLLGLFNLLVVYSCELVGWLVCFGCLFWFDFAFCWFACWLLFGFLFLDLVLCTDFDLFTLCLTWVLCCDFNVWSDLFV